MKKRSLLLLIPLVIFLISLTLLLTGSPLLGINLLGKTYFPLGTLSTWLGMIALSCLVYLIFSRSGTAPASPLRWFQGAAVLGILLGISWGFIGYGLAGTWAFNFSGNAPGFVGSSEAGKYFWNISYFIVGWPLTLLALFILYRLVKTFSTFLQGK